MCVGGVQTFVSRTRLAVQRAEDLPNPEDHFGEDSAAAVSSADAAIAGVVPLACLPAPLCHQL